MNIRARGRLTQRKSMGYGRAAIPLNVGKVRPKILGRPTTAPGIYSAKRLRAGRFQVFLTKVQAAQNPHVATLREPIDNGFRGKNQMAFDLYPGLSELLIEHTALWERAQLLGREVHFSVSTRTVGGTPLRSFAPSEHAHNTDKFLLDDYARGEATAELKVLGFEVHNQGWFDIHVSGTAEQVAALIGKRLTLQLTKLDRLLVDDESRQLHIPSPDDLFLAPLDELVISARTINGADCFFPRPVESFAAAPVPSSTPPVPNFHHVTSADIRTLLNVPPNANGDGIIVAVVDTGFYRHPYYIAQKYDYCPTWAMPPRLPDDDPDGHGTAIALNLFAVAPNVKMRGYVRDPAPHLAIQQAVQDGADIISCSWGVSQTPDVAMSVLEATISHAINAFGKVVIFASGNGPLKAWPASMRDVISVGGVYWNLNHQFEASNYGSGFISDAYPGRMVPDVCGLCGQMPAGVYMMLPCPAGSPIDAGAFAAGLPYPNGDGLPQGDGWAGMSGTSSAAPQVAGVAALLLQKAKLKKVALTPAAVKTLLQDSAAAVTAGVNAHNFAANANQHPNPAVGYGIVDAAAALAKL